MEPSVFKFILRHSWRQQLRLLILTGISFPFLYASLDLPKTIINEAIDGKSFPKSLLGTSLDQVEYLMALCFAFLALVLVNGGFKYWINVLKGQLGERMLRRLRYILFSRVLRFPLSHFRKISQGEIIAMITAETEPLGGFIGDAFALPAFQGGTLLTILAFMFVQDPLLGVAAVAFYPLQMYLIPKLQQQVNLLAQERVRKMRRLSQRIGEAVSGVQEIRAHDTSEWELAKFSARAGTIYGIRYQIYRRKFFIKFLNNFIAMVTPFFFFSIGGYLVIKGSLSFGSLVAVLAAYKDLSPPWKELLDYYQQKEDIRIKYEQLIERFQPAGMLDESLQRIEPDRIPSLPGPIIATNLVLEEDGGIKLVDGATFSLPAAARTALLGPSGAGRSALAKLLARLRVAAAGVLRVANESLATLPEAVTGRRIAYVDGSTYIFSGSVGDNLVYALKHRPAPGTPSSEGPRARADFVHEALASGNTTSDVDADWIDYRAAGVSNAEALMDRVIEVLRVVGLERDIYTRGLHGTIDPAERPDLAKKILDGRAFLHQKLKEPEFAGLVERFDPHLYNNSMTVAENLLFGNPVRREFQPDRLAENPYVLSVLTKVGLAEEFLSTGAKLAAIMVELFQGLPPDHEFFERYSFIGADDLAEYQHLVRRVESGGLSGLEEAARTRLMSLPFKLVTDRHRLGLVDDKLQKGILEARRVFAQELPERLAAAVAFFDPGEYNPAASIQDNILFGKTVFGRKQAPRLVSRLIEEVVETLGLRRAILEVGLDSPVGIGGSRLTLAERQRLAIARCLLKRPDLLIVDGAVTALDPASQRSMLDNVLKDMEGRGVIWVLDSVDLAEHFDHALLMEGGKIVDHGPVDELRREGRLAAGSAAAD